MDKTFPENIKDIRTAVMASEVREGIAQGMEYVEQFASTATTKAAEAAASAAAAAKSAENASTAVSAAIDPTLSVSGKAADAKVTGEGLATRMITGIHTEFDPNAITNLDSFYTPGSQYVNQTAVIPFKNDLNLTTSTINDSYWSIINIAPITNDNENYDIVQFLIGSNSISKKQLIYKRFSISRVWSKFERIDSTFIMELGKTYDGETLDFFALGSSSVSTQAVIKYQTDLNLSTDTINGRFWSVINIAPITRANEDYDVVQFLIGSGSISSNQFIYKRFSISRAWSKFERFADNTINKISNPQKIAFLGDSFTEHYNTISYVDYLGEMPEYEVTNMGHGGLTAGTWMDRYSSNITNEYDTYFVAFGLNADTNGIGTADSTDNATFYGGFNNLLSTIVNTCPKARIILWCMDAWMTKDKSDRELEIATKYGCEFYSMKADANIPLRIDGKFTGVMEGLADSVISAKTDAFVRAANDHHPNAIAQYMLATYLKNII